ncbi:ribonuclease 1 [Arachis ipaensis]|uniref:ribonuclease 1 n=1 Tax=Arachis ipaensis TaxID=130454 RepID=UPI0007AFB6A8|nr:ribonuclease 1 [Arachis ipaensis]
MEFKESILIKLVVMLQCLTLVLCASQDFLTMMCGTYIIEVWPGSYCDTQQSCCYPTSGKPDADFGIHGLWPNYNDGSYPSNCDSSNPFQQSQVSNLISTMQKEWPTLACPSGNGIQFWSHEWDKHGTCSESLLNQHDYFEAALNLKQKANLLQALTSAGINPDGGFYSLSSIKNAISDSIGFTPFIECNSDSSGNSQLYQVYLCVDTNASSFIDCPVFPHGKCASNIEFSSF